MDPPNSTFSIASTPTPMEAAEALRESEDLLQRIGEMAKVGAWEWDLRTGRPHWSLETFRIHELEPPVIPSFRRAIRFYPREVRHRLSSVIRQARDHGEPWDLEVPFVTAKGRSLWVRIQGSAIMEHGRPVKLRGAFHDITERKLIEAEKDHLAELNLQHQKAESLSRMAGAIAHHFNNQLQAVMGNIELVMDHHTSGSAAKRAMTDAMTAARKAAEMSSLMLTYLGQHREIAEPLDLADLTRETLRLLRARQPSHIVVESTLPCPGPPVMANAQQLQQVLTQLLTNAWEAIGQSRGVIRVTVTTAPVARVPLANRAPIDCHLAEPEYACLEVSDSGCGIDHQGMEKIYDPFYSTKFIGRGLGLPVALGIVRALHGAITIESQPGLGSVFRVFLPLSNTAPARRRGPLLAARRPPRKATVLVVEDEPGVRAFATLALTQSGHSVLTAEDGFQAVSVFQQKLSEIDCVVCDVTMRGMSGWDTLLVLRQLKPSIPVIFVSGHREEVVMAGGVTERPQRFLQKPYETRALLEAVQQVLDESESEGGGGGGR